MNPNVLDGLNRKEHRRSQLSAGTQFRRFSLKYFPYQCPHTPSPMFKPGTCLRQRSLHPDDTLRALPSTPPMRRQLIAIRPLA